MRSRPFTPSSLTDMGKYFIAFALSYLAALLAFAVMGTVSLFRWPVGPVPGVYSFLWTLFPLAASFLGGLLFAKRWASSVGTFAPSGLIVLLVVMSVLTFLARQTPLTAPGQNAAAALSAFLPTLPTAFVMNLCFPALFHLGWRLGA